MVAQQTLTLFVWVQILVPLPKSLGLKEPRLFFEVWLSLVERYVRDVEAAGSNPVTSTTSRRGLVPRRIFLRKMRLRRTAWSHLPVRSVLDAPHRGAAPLLPVTLRLRCSLINALAACYQLFAEKVLRCTQFAIITSVVVANFFARAGTASISSNPKIGRRGRFLLLHSSLFLPLLGTGAAHPLPPPVRPVRI